MLPQALPRRLRHQHLLSTQEILNLHLLSLMLLLRPLVLSLRLVQLDRLVLLYLLHLLLQLAQQPVVELSAPIFLRRHP